MGRLPLAIALTASCLLAGCPDEVDEIGGAPKRQIDHAQESLEKASDNIEERIKRAAEAAEK